MTITAQHTPEKSYRPRNDSHVERPPESYRTCYDCHNSTFNILDVYNEKGNPERMEIRCVKCDRVEIVVYI